VFDFANEFSQSLLHAHTENQRAYLCQEIGVEPNQENAQKIDKAYEELLELELVEQVSGQRVMVYAGGVPRNLYRITSKGLDYRNTLSKLGDKKP
jgi:hypothetical protein